MNATNPTVWAEALAGVNVHAIDQAVLTVPVPTVWDLGTGGEG